jgi:hypothetical protein
MVMVLKHWAEAHIPYRKTRKMVAANKKIGLEVSAEEAKYMVMSRDQHARQNRYVCVGNKSFKRLQ